MKYKPFGVGTSGILSILASFTAASILSNNISVDVVILDCSTERKVKKWFFWCGKFLSEECANNRLHHDVDIILLIPIHTTYT